MGLEPAAGRADTPSEEAIRTELARILGSPSFRQAARAGRLLRYLVEQTRNGCSRDLREYVIGVEAFDKGEGFDPKSDSSVRVEIARLRARLQKYYDGAGHDDPLLIQIPKGAYAAVFVERRAPAKPRRRRWALPVLVLAVAGVILGGVLGWQWVSRRLGGAPRTSLAVLPFTNLSTSAEVGYFADGFTDELIATLGRQPQLRVVARTSVFRFKGTREDVRRIAEQLHAGAVLEGSVHPAEGRMKVTAQLIDGRSGYHIWSQTVEGAPEEASRMVEEITAAVKQALNGPDPPGQHRAAGAGG